MRKWLLILSVFIGVSAFAQEFKRKDVDTVQNKESKTHFYGLDTLTHHKTQMRVDTHLNDIHWFLPVDKNDYFPIYTGNFIGATYKPLHQNIGWNLGNERFSNIKLHRKDLLFNSTHIPLTRVSFAAGDPAQQFFELMHHQSLLPNVQLGLFYDRASSDGMFENQEASLTNYAIQFKRHSLDKHHHEILGFRRNNLLIRENGGIPSLVGITDFTFSQTPEVRNSRTKAQDFEFYFDHFHDYGGDSISVPLDDSNHYCIAEPTWRIGHSLSYGVESNSYIDDGTSNQTLYSEIRLDSSATIDSTWLQSYANNFSIQHWSSKKKYTYEVDSNGIVRVQEKDIEQSWFKVESSQRYYVFGSYFLNQLYNSFLEVDVQGQFRWKGWHGLYNQVIAGRRIGDHRIYCAYQKGKLNFSAEQLVNKPVLLAQFYEGNHQQWSNDFSSVVTRNLQLNYGKKKDYAGVKLMSIGNYVYWDSTMQSAQFDSLVLGAQVDLSKEFHFGIFHLHQLIRANYVLQGNSVLRLPFVQSYTRFHAEGLVFKKRMWIQLGLENRWSMAYNGYGYSPATGQFYVQNTQLVEGTPRLNAFFNFKVQRARFFILAENLLALPDQLGPLNFNHPYYNFSVADHPLNNTQFMIRFGLKWKFYY